MPAATAALSAVNTLRNSENGALGGGQSFYTGTGRGAAAGDVKVSGKKKGKGALIAILMLLFGGGAFLGSSNSMLAPAMESLFTEATDTQYTSASLRGTRIMKMALSGEGAITTSWTGAKKYTSMSVPFKNRLKKAGITVNGFPGSHRTLTFTNSQGVEIEVTADKFLDTFRNNAEFREAYTGAKRGRVATFFDKIADKIYKKLGISRNLFGQFQQTGNSDVDATNYRNTMSDKFDGNTSQLVDVEQRTESHEVDDGNGGTKTETTTTRDQTTMGDATSNNSVETANSKARAMISDIASTVSQVGSIACTVMRVMSMISVVVAANEIYQSINYFMGLSENISKMKAGYGDASALNEVLNFMSTPATTTTTNLGRIEIDVTNETYNANDSATVQTGSPLEANGMQMILAEAPANKNTTGLYSLERVMKAGGAAFTTSVTAANTCAAVDAAGALVSIGVTIASFGAAKIVSTIAQIALNTAIAIGISAILGFLVPTIAKAMFTNAFETATGIPAGELFARGSSAANTRLGRTGSGQSLSSPAAAVAYNKATNEVLALDAEVDRLRRSPFDITSKNTFLGSIAYSLLPTITSTKMTSISSLVRSTSTSFASLLTSVHAEGENTSYMTTFGSCDTLAGIGAVGDIYCNPVTTTDLSTIDIVPNDGTKYVAVLKDELNCDDDGVCEVKDNTDLAKYITYCDNRDSPFGIVDQNILGDLQTSSNLGGFKSFINSIPIIGDLMTLVDSAQDTINQGWATGEKCGNTDKNSEFWKEKGRYYQRYVEDMRILDDMGAFSGENDANPVTAYEEKYEAAHPLDNSYEGYISRISGLTKDNVKIVLAFIDYYNYINEYEPTTRLAHAEAYLHDSNGATVVAMITSHHPYFDDSDRTTPVAPTKEYVIYNDLRTRNVVC